ncbi:YhcN/YlaJ family sporulation lipoprotein [Metabacillus litoralis]|uniref:YhcN/YlaJ family sporulation lipoprotein n=1 Tax=Metabacillus litoralis TaxID=152268 RepID=UPI001CFEF1D7|nr:YhcN/YlaJ family sporulation lipoprotein [Metabacillus litoralis]
MINVKKASTFTAIALLTTGLTGCNGNEGALDTGNNNNARPIGYYSNENTEVDNEGPITEMMDGMNNKDNNYFQRVNNRTNTNMPNPTLPLGGRDSGLVRDNRYSHGDANYHGHLNEVGYYNRGDGAISDKVKNAVEKMDNVDDARVLVTDDNVLVAVDTHDRNDKDMKNQITSEIRKMTKGRNVQVVTDEGTVTRVRNIDNDIRSGADRKTIDTNVTELMDDLGDAIQRPFNGDR